ncbi:unnamed protein product [Onchocerca ochengi]|uniref:WAPL domain-containing protein n=1 Tax=Onchocerca ochengi TaxID=42157 RepID=A0A182EGC9_ONCOC|nr:unnamed protein product [Onchocerca ochengi]
MVEWLSLYLGGKLSPTALDYGCALLLNLCLDPSGRSAASRVATIFTTTIANLISDHKLQVCTYINGILFTILGIAQIKARVKEINLVNTVKEKLNNHHCKDDEKQLPIIYKILNGESKYDVKSHHRYDLCRASFITDFSPCQQSKYDVT